MFPKIIAVIYLVLGVWAAFVTGSDNAPFYIVNANIFIAVCMIQEHKEKKDGYRKTFE